MNSEMTLSPAQKRRQDQTPVTVPRGLLALALQSVEYEIDDRTSPVPSDEARERDSWQNARILRELYAAEAELEHFMGNRLNDHVIVRTSYGSFFVDLRGYPIGPLLEGLKHVTRIDLAEWRARNGGCEPHTVSLSDVDHWEKRQDCEPESLIHHLTKDNPR